MSDKFHWGNWWAKALISFLCAWGIIVCLSWQYRNLPYYWDGVLYVWPNTKEIYDANLNPFLRDFDVGHPTAHGVASAALMKVFGPTPIVARFLQWAFAALLVAAVYGIGRVLKMPAAQAMLTSLMVLFFPLCWANAQLLLTDLPMISAAMAAFYFWGRERWALYFLAASYAVLTKMQGFVLIVALIPPAFIFTFLERKENKVKFYKNQFSLTVLPVLSLPIFMLARTIVRGPGARRNFDHGVELLPFWHFSEFFAKRHFMYNIHYQVTMLNYVFFLILILLSLFLIRLALLGKIKKTLLRASIADVGRDQARIFFALCCLPVSVSGAYFQTAVVQCPRYNMPTAVVFLLLLSLLARGLFQKNRFVIPFQLIIIGCFVIFWHPGNAEKLPWPLSKIKKNPASYLYYMEADLRFVDIIELMRWGGQTIIQDAKENNRVLGVATIQQAAMNLKSSELGYARENIATTHWEGSEKLDKEKFPYVFIVRSLAGNSESSFPDPDAKPIASKTLWHCEAFIWRFD
jgi:4-amino-4-deoxy-L-arabinose transferase-like glycosyltransferase